MESVLITGGAGYIGSHVMEILFKQGKKVRVLENGMFGFNALSPFKEYENLEVINGDLRNVPDIKKAVRGMDTVIHLAGIVGNPACSYDKVTCQDINVTATQRLAAESAAYGVQRFIFASSCSVYGFGNTVFNEESPLNPVDYYAESKILGEECLEEFTADMALTTCRFATVFGASRRMRFDLALNGMTAAAVSEGVCAVHGGGQWRPFIHCHDVALALCLINNAPVTCVANNVFNIGDDRQNMTLADLGKIIGRLIPGTRISILGELTDHRSYQVSFSKINQTLGFSANTTIEQGIHEIAMLLKSHITPNYLMRIYSNIKTIEQLSA